MKIEKRNNLRLLVQVLVLNCLVFSFSAMPQDAADKPMEAKALSALIEELKGVVSRTAPDKNEAKLVAGKWDQRNDLTGKTQKEVVDLLYADVEAVIKDSGTRYQIFSMFSFYKRVPVSSKDKPVARLVDDFQRANCEGVLARFDNFAVELQNSPSSGGFVVTYGEPYARRTAEREIKNAIRNKAMDSKRIAFASSGSVGTNARVAFWLIPPGADVPKIAAADTSVDLKINTNTKPYIFGQKSVGDLGGCSEYDPEFFAEVMNANPASRGNIVIYETSRRKFREMEKEILLKLTSSGITRKRLRTFYVRVKPEGYREGVELWLLP